MNSKFKVQNSKLAEIQDLLRRCRALLAVAHRSGDEGLMRELSQLRERLKKLAGKYCACGRVKNKGTIRCAVCNQTGGHKNPKTRMARAKLKLAA